MDVETQAQEGTQIGVWEAGVRSYTYGTWHRCTRDQPNGSEPFIPYDFTPYPGAPKSISFPTDVAPTVIPAAGYFYTDYISKYAQDPALSIMLHMQSIQLQISNNINKFLQTGFRFPNDTPAAPPPPGVGQEGDDEDGIHQEDAQ